MFDVATRNKYRFEAPQGLISVEELWDLNLHQLDDIAKNIHRKVKEDQEESFITDVQPQRKVEENKLDVVKAIIQYKLEQRDAAVNRQKALAKRNKVLALLEEKEDEDLKSLSKEELEAML